MQESDPANNVQYRKYRKMTVEPVDRLVRQLAVPTVITMLITAFYNIVDTFFVGQLGPSATGSIGVVYSFMTVIQAIGFGFGHGSGNYISRKLGEQNVEEASVMAMVGFISSFLCGLVIAMVGLTFISPLTTILGTTETIRPYAIRYLAYILLGAPFFASSLTLNNQLRLQGNAQKAMIGILSGTILNCMLDPLFIFTFNMGISGAGLATFISQMGSFLILLYQSQHGDSVKLRFRNFLPTKQRYIAILQGGIPSLSRQGMHCLANIALNHAMKAFGDNFFAAITIVIRLSNLLFAVTAGIGQGFQPVCGYNYGAGYFDRVRSAYLYTLRLATITLLILTTVLLLFTSDIIALFSNVPAVVEYGVFAQRWQCVSIPFIGLCIIVSMLLQNINQYKEATFMALCRSGIFFIPIIFIFPHVIGMFGIIVAQPVSDLCSFGVALVMQRKILRKLKKEAKTE